MSDHVSDPPRADRRTLLGAGGLLLLGAAAGCTSSGSPSSAVSGTAGPAGTGGTGSAGPTASGAAQPSATPVTPSATGAGGGSGGEPSIARSPGPDITSGPTTRSEVALTFHGQGDDAINRQIREALDQAGAKATIFAVGTWVMGDPQQVRAFAAEGHEIGNHTWSHLDLPAVDLATATDEITRGREALTQVLGTPGWWFRPSSTKSSTETIRAAAAAAGYPRCVSYGVDPEDFRDPGPEVVRQRVAAAVAAGSIVSLHLGHLGTAQAMPGILAELSSRGLRAVTLSTLLRD